MFGASWKRWAVLVAAVGVAVMAPVAGRWWYAAHPAAELAVWIPFVVLAVLGFSMVGATCGWDYKSLGLTLNPAPDFGFWLRVGLLGGAAILVFALAMVGLASNGGPDPFGINAQQTICSSGTRILEMLLLAPIFEEVLYRLVLCTALVGVGGNSLAVLGGGLGFAWLHWYSGVLGPDNLLAGFFFSWAFIRSETILVPVTFHCRHRSEEVPFPPGSAGPGLECNRHEDRPIGSE
jgi:membrane protease YdiL (CAAX protease family)